MVCEAELQSPRGEGRWMRMDEDGWRIDQDGWRMDEGWMKMDEGGTVDK